MIQFNIFYANCMYSCVICISLICTRMSLVCHSYVTRVYSYAILMSLVCTCMTFICHSYVLVSNVISLAYSRISSVCHSCHLYFSRMCSYIICLACNTYVIYVICMSLACTLCNVMSLVCTRISPVRHSFVVSP